MAFTEREQEVIRRLEEEFHRGPGGLRRRLARLWWRHPSLLSWSVVLVGFVVMVAALPRSVPLSFLGAVLLAIGAGRLLGRTGPGTAGRLLGRISRAVGLD